MPWYCQPFLDETLGESISPMCKFPEKHIGCVLREMSTLVNLPF